MLIMLVAITANALLIMKEGTVMKVSETENLFKQTTGESSRPFGLAHNISATISELN